jgi:uncharacterized membrane protein
VNGTSDAPATGSRRLANSRLAIVLAGVLVMLYIVLPPHSLVAKADLIGYGICHQDPARSYFVGGTQLPLCARCSGTYLGGLVTLVILLVRKQRRHAGMPTTVALSVFAAGFAFFAIDGANSYASYIPWLPHLYTPDNRLRLASGLLCGAGMVGVLVPLFNYSVWRRPEEATILGGRGLLAVLAALGLTYLAVTQARGWMYYPLAFLSVAGVALVLTMVNGLLALLLLRRERQAEGWLDAVFVLGAGVLLTAAELGGMSSLRYVLERSAGLRPI